MAHYHDGYNAELRAVSNLPELQALINKAEADGLYLYSKHSLAAVDYVYSAVNPKKVRLLCDDGKLSRESTFQRLYVNYKFVQMAD